MNAQSLMQRDFLFVSRLKLKNFTAWPWDNLGQVACLVCFVNFFAFLLLVIKPVL